MAAPANTVWQPPTGARLRDGFRMLITFALNPTVALWVDIDGGIKPPGVDGGAKVATSTMLNTTYRTFASRSLKELTDATVVWNYDTKALDQILALVNNEGSISLWYPDDTSLDFWGFLQNWEPDPIVEGEMPSSSATITCTNTDPSDGSEAGWVLTEGTGTY
jgi:hypothetical protein